MINSARRRPTWMSILLLSMAIWAALSLLSPAISEIYRWTDAQGQVHFGQQPPVDAEATTVNAPPPPDLTNEEAAARSEQITESNRAYQEARETAAKEKAEMVELAAENDRLCTAAAERVQRLQLHRRYNDSEGNTIDDGRRLERLQEAREQQSEYCG